MTEDQSKTDGKLSISAEEIEMRTNLKVRLKDFLRRRPGNFSAAAKEFGLTRSKVEKLVEESQTEFDDVENEYLDNLEECVFLSALGTPPSQEFSFNEAMKILEKKRPSRWAGKLKVEQKKAPTLGKGVEDILKQHFANKG